MHRLQQHLTAKFQLGYPRVLELWPKLGSTRQRKAIIGRGLLLARRERQLPSIPLSSRRLQTNQTKCLLPYATRLVVSDP